MELPLSSLATQNSELLVNVLQSLITNVTKSSSTDEQKRYLEQTLNVLSELRKRAPMLSQHLSNELKKRLVEIEPALIKIGFFAMGIGAAVAFTGLLVQGASEKDDDRLNGREMTLAGGSVALGAVEVVKMIKEVVAELKQTLNSKSKSA